MSGIGHNGGPSMEAGYGFRKVAWKKARQSLLPSLPLEIVRVRVARAKRWACPTRPMPTIRATSGGTSWRSCFPGNALGLVACAACLPEAVRAGRLEDAWRRGGAAGGGLCAAHPEAVMRGDARPRRGGGGAHDPDTLGRGGRAPARLRAGAGFAARWRRAGLGHRAGARLVRRGGAGRQPERRGVFRAPAQ
jgi:hypothetical protein